MKKKRLRVRRSIINLEEELKGLPIEFGNKNKILIRKGDLVKEINIESLNLKEIKQKIEKELAS
jgi:hypothetical protein